MELDELADLMAEPPGGHNGGRRRTYEGGDGIKGFDGWQPLETGRFDIPSFKRYHEPRIEDKVPRQHGTRYTYQKVRCRCAVCRAWNTATRRAQRIA